MSSSVSTQPIGCKANYSVNRTLTRCAGSRRLPQALDGMGTKSSQRWDVPFRKDVHPSVTLISEPDGASTASLVVAPRGLGGYPKYIVRFSAVYALTCEEEAQSVTELGMPEQGDYAYIWADSPYTKSYASLFPDFAFRGGESQIKHYVVLGGDNCASVVSAAEPSIERLDGPVTITVAHAV